MQKWYVEADLLLPDLIKYLFSFNHCLPVKPNNLNADSNKIFLENFICNVNKTATGKIYVK